MQDFFIAVDDKLTKLSKDQLVSEAESDGTFYTSHKAAQDDAATGMLIYKIQATYMGKVEPHTDDDEEPGDDDDDYCSSYGYCYWECECE